MQGLEGSRIVKEWCKNSLKTHLYSNQSICRYLLSSCQPFSNLKFPLFNHRTCRRMSSFSPATQHEHQTAATSVAALCRPTRDISERWGPLRTPFQAFSSSFWQAVSYHQWLWKRWHRTATVVVTMVQIRTASLQRVSHAPLLAS